MYSSSRGDSDRGIKQTQIFNESATSVDRGADIDIRCKQAQKKKNNLVYIFILILSMRPKLSVYFNIRVVGV